jgi:hypothetical protein
MRWRFLFAVRLAFGSLATAQDAPEPYLRCFNDSTKAVNFYVDGKFGCSIPANAEGNLAYCDAEIGNGKHTLTIRAPKLPRQSCDLFVGEGTHAEANLSRGERFRCSEVLGNRR